MKNLMQLTTVLFLLVQTIGYSQTKKPETISKKNDTILKKQNTTPKMNEEKLKKFVGEFILAEANLTLEIVKEKDGMYLVSDFSKDLLIQKDENTLHEFTRGVDLKLIKDNKDALQFTQNGYKTIIKRVKKKEVKK